MLKKGPDARMWLVGRATINSETAEAPDCTLIDRGQGKPHEVGVDGRRACKTAAPTNTSPEEWKKMSHGPNALGARGR